MLRALMTSTAILLAFPALAQDSAGADAGSADTGGGDAFQAAPADSGMEAAAPESGADVLSLPPAEPADMTSQAPAAPATDLPVADMPAAAPLADSAPAADSAPIEAAPLADSFPAPAPESVPFEADPAVTAPEAPAAQSPAGMAADFPASAPAADTLGETQGEVSLDEPAPSAADLAASLPSGEPVPAPAPVSDPVPATDMPAAAPVPEATTPLPADAPVSPVGEAGGGVSAEDLEELLPADPSAPGETAPEAPAATAPAPDAPATTPEAPPAGNPAAVPEAEVPAGPVDVLSGESEGEVTEVTVSEDMARASSEDFRDNDRGLSSDAKAALFGLGGFALGHMLADRGTVALNTGDRVVVTGQDGTPVVVKNDDAMLIQPGYQVRTEEFADGSSRSTILRPDGSQVVTLRDAGLRVLSRRVIGPDGREVVLLDNTVTVTPVDVRLLPPPPVPQPVVTADPQALRQALLTVAPVDRTFSLQQVLTIREVRDLAAPVGVPDITFATGSAAITADQARSLAALGNTLKAMIDADPREVFLIEGHTDTVGDDLMNLALSDRRAESLAKALTEHFGVRAENMVVQGYGERHLLVQREGDVRENRRAAVRRITGLLAGR